MPIVIHNHWIDKLAVFSGAVSGLALYPQVYLILRSGEIAGATLVMFSIILLNSIVWLVYSMHRGLFTLAIPSILNILSSTVVLVWFLVY